MRSTSIVLVFLLGLLAAAPQAQQTSASPQQPVFRGGVDLVRLDVRVVDKDGKPVPGLTADDFTVTLDGQPRPVKALDYLTFGASAGTDTSAPDGAVSNQAAQPASRGGRVILFMVDDLSSRPLEIKELTTAAERLLPTLDPSDLVGVATTSGRGPSLSPTRDREKVLAALRSKEIVGRADARPTPFVTVNEAIEIVQNFDQTVLAAVVARECGGSPGRGATNNDKCQSMIVGNSREIVAMTTRTREDQLNAYIMAIAALRTAPVPRVLVALTRGVALNHYEPSPLDPVSQAAAAADVAFYAVVSADDTGVDLSDGTTAQARRVARVQEGLFLVDNTAAVAQAAGGVALHALGQPDRLLTQIVREASALYQLGIAVPSGADPYHVYTVKVAVRRPGLTVHSNVHALRAAPDAAPAPSVPETLQARLAQGGAAFGTPMNVAARLRRDPASDRLQLIVALEVPGATAGPLTAMFALLNSAGATVQSGQTSLTPTPKADYRLALPLAVDDGDYRLRVAVADAHGNVGSVEEPVAAHLHRFGALLTSDLLLASAGSDGTSHVLALEAVPAQAASLSVGLELYAAPFPPDITVRLRIAPADGGSVLDEAELTPTEDHGRAMVSWGSAVPAWPVGRYTVTATVLEAGQPVGTLSADVRKIE